MKKSNVPKVTEEIIKAFENVESKNNRSLSTSVFKGNIVQDLIHEIDGIPVILDIDLAKLYDCKNGTKEINQAVKNNLEKFPKSYSWVLSDEEFQILRSKFLTSNDINRMGNRRYKVRVFTESGTWMLSTILKTPIASQVTMMIINAFVAMRRYIGTSLIEQKSINSQVLLNTQSISQNKQNTLENTKNITKNRYDIDLQAKELEKHDKYLQQNIHDIELLKNIVFEDKDKNKNAVFYKGQIYDAYSLLVDIINGAKEEVIIVDGYAGKETLDIISKVQTKVILIVREISKRSNLLNIDIENIMNSITI